MEYASGGTSIDDAITDGGDRVVGSPPGCHRLAREGAVGCVELEPAQRAVVLQDVEVTACVDGDLVHSGLDGVDVEDIAKGLAGYIERRAVPVVGEHPAVVGLDAVDPSVWPGQQLGENIETGPDLGRVALPRRGCRAAQIVELVEHELARGLDGEDVLRWCAGDVRVL